MTDIEHWVHIGVGVFRRAYAANEPLEVAVRMAVTEAVAMALEAQVTDIPEAYLSDAIEALDGGHPG